MSAGVKQLLSHSFPTTLLAPTARPVQRGEGWAGICKVSLLQGVSAGATQKQSRHQPSHSGEGGSLHCICRCRLCTAASALPPLHWRLCTGASALAPLHCRLRTAASALPPLHWRLCTGASATSAASAASSDRPESETRARGQSLPVPPRRN